MHDDPPKTNPDFPKVCRVLESIARAYEEESEEAVALEEAAHAYIFLQSHLNLKHSYENYRRLNLEGLSEMQMQHLRDMGIDPDEEQPEPDGRPWPTS